MAHGLPRLRLQLAALSIGQDLADLVLRLLSGRYMRKPYHMALT